MSIPGTHNTCTLSLVPWVSTQNMTVLAQLNAGIRYLDLRCRLVDATLMMYHSLYSLDLTFNNVMNDIYALLRSHSGEGLIVQLSNEYTDDPEFSLFAETAAAGIRTNDNLWNVGVSIPMFADIRGKIQLIRRYNADKAEHQIGIEGFPFHTKFLIYHLLLTTQSMGVYIPRKQCEDRRCQTKPTYHPPPPNPVIIHLLRARWDALETDGANCVVLVGRLKRDPSDYWRIAFDGGPLAEACCGIVSPEARLLESFMKEASRTGTIPNI
ncbi:PLC-like phosphodiesterase [Lentinula aciculospora]|uniref:PLC-like phosphodiesterase n=1 Tax=Lentinula aciculospora TaxID=153920 RepID=A0A9W9A3V4_9AGAR|nr:PLC-like phosphodiesterase [Lentinula aciculospora]